LKNNTTTTPKRDSHGKKSRIPGKKQTSDIIARIIVLPKKPSTITHQPTEVSDKAMEDGA
jgi:hypothetical protein